ncbi:MAG: hypothetical protein J3R72DRAFT_158473 [Linnemannia gamsii]|nr:MAG: hypothetical protein J3R72DRAFT_158473 [Linnemannia gamsii]
MSTSFPLPLECLQMIIRQLANDGDTNTLACLLRTNKHFCSATLPILYKDPFRVLSVNPTIAVARNVPTRLSKLIKLLLHSNPDTLVSDLLRAAFLQDPAEPKDSPSAPETTAIPYHSLLTSVEIHFPPFLFASIFQSAHIGFGDYLERCELAERFVLEGIFDRHKIGKLTIMPFVATQALCNDLAWALWANARRIRSLVIPISDVTRYLSIVGRFELLADVTFVSDKDIREAPRLERRATPTEQKVMTRLRAERIQHLEEMVLFVQEHRRLLPNVLASGRCINGRNCKGECPEEYRLRLLQSLPPLINPRSLNHINWIQFIAKAQDTNLSFVKSFELPSAPGDASLYLSPVSESFLHRCRMLECFKTTSINEGVFHWAVDERRRYNADIAAGRRPQHALVPLSSFIVKNGNLLAGDQINDVAFAFGNTLESIEISGQWRPQHLDQDESDTAIDDDESIWCLPRLSKLTAEMEADDTYLNLRPEFLSRCSRLVTVNLCDKLHEYDLSCVHYWKPAALPHLTNLHLRGTPAVSFHPTHSRTHPNSSNCILRYVGSEVHITSHHQNSLLASNMANQATQTPSSYPHQVLVQAHPFGLGTGSFPS